MKLGSGPIYRYLGKHIYPQNLLSSIQLINRFNKTKPVNFVSVGFLVSSTGFIYYPTMCQNSVDSDQTASEQSDLDLQNLLIHKMVYFGNIHVR